MHDRQTGEMVLFLSSEHELEELSINPYFGVVDPMGFDFDVARIHALDMLQLSLAEPVTFEVEVACFGDPLALTHRAITSPLPRLSPFSSEPDPSSNRAHDSSLRHDVPFHAGDAYDGCAEFERALRGRQPTPIP